MTGATRQTIDQLRAEIAFRAKLARQHVDGEVLLPDYYTKEQHDRILLGRIDETRRRMSALEAAGIVLSPFLELGAERGQRSLVLVNAFGATGIAADISFHQLRSMEHYAELFGLPNLPMRICCDANRLPFRTGAFPFVFGYQFLHHFPSLEPVLGEVRRVLGRGCFFFDEEPFRRMLRLRLYQQRNKPYSAAASQRSTHRRVAESFIASEPTDEEEHGVLENDDISLTAWASALSAFDDHDVELRSIYGLRSRLRNRPSLGNGINWLLGGMIGGVGRQPSGVDLEAGADLLARLECPECRVDAAVGEFDGVLETSGTDLVCISCGARYPTRDGVVFLMPGGLRSALYPEV